MLDRIEVGAIDTSHDILVVADQMLPEMALPDAAFTMPPADRGAAFVTPRVAGRSAGHASALDPPYRVLKLLMLSALRQAQPFGMLRMRIKVQRRRSMQRRVRPSSASRGAACRSG